MNATAIGNQYARLTPQERFCLILAAAARGDDSDRGRLMNVGEQITLSMRDHSPYVQAFEEVALPTLIDLLAKTADLLEATTRVVLARYHVFGLLDAEPVLERMTGTKPMSSFAEEPPCLQRAIDEALAAGFVLRTSSAGWSLFCERWTFAPFWLWEGYPGFERLQRALALAEQASFDAEGMTQWLNALRPKDAPETMVESLITAEKVANAVEDLFRQRVRSWGGSPASGGSLSAIRPDGLVEKGK